MTILVQQLKAEIDRLTRERDQLKVNVDALLCDCPEYSDVERLCHVLGYLGYSTPSGGEASARWLSLVKELIGAVETSELLRRDKEAVAEYRQLKAENAELRQDKARLDRGYIMTGVPGVNACEHRGVDLRAAIDQVTQLDEQRAQRQAMTKEQP